MNKEEAIANLNMISVAFVDPVTKEQRKLIDDTFKMAIQALSQEPCERFEWGIDGNVYKITKAKNGKEICQQVCDDAISRDMALEKMADYVASGYADSAEDFEEYSRIICQLPSVTQNPKYWIDKDNKIYKMPDDIPTMTIQYPTITHGDTISRTEVMKVISDFVTFEKYIDKHNHITFEPLEKMINALPSVTQKSGKWIPVSEDLPEYTINDKVSEDVLVFDGTDIRVGEYRKGIHLHGAGYWRAFGYEIDEHVDVIAWMPLPKPYDPQKSEDK